ncbi:MAG: DUF1294 domain-containing protein [Bacteroidales bacterium]|nr:DUF1294 domain-containing protein [Anaerotignum sp.]MCI5679887.1 DUF1294 domain-containing protein [Bacteroidales bacterium]MDY3926588.1 DUF1294 domain-containing protein [Anaerotignum sp.]
MEMYFNGTALAIIVGYYLIINIIMYVAMVIDKKRAMKDGWRIPEKNLYLLAVLGGGTGGLIAMVTKHHKNRHLDFIMVFTITAILHFIVAFLAISRFAFVMN